MKQCCEKTLYRIEEIIDSKIENIIKYKNTLSRPSRSRYNASISKLKEVKEDIIWLKK